MAPKRELTVVETFHIWLIVALEFVHSSVLDLFSTKKAEDIKKPKIRLGRHSVLPGKKPMKKTIKKDYEF